MEYRDGRKVARWRRQKRIPKDLYRTFFSFNYRRQVLYVWNGIYGLGYDFNFFI